MRRLRRIHGTHPRVLLAGAAVSAAVIGASQLPYVNWRRVAPPIDAPVLEIRHDAKGDGRFLAPRSGNRRHRGIDLTARMDSPVRAIRSGRVLEAGMHRGLGRFVRLQHGGGLDSLYAHLEALRVEVGQRVRQGQIIGTVGKTGNARHPWIMPHLHLEITRRGELLDPHVLGLDVIDPEAVMEASGRGPEQRGPDASGGE